MRYRILCAGLLASVAAGAGAAVAADYAVRPAPPPAVAAPIAAPAYISEWAGFYVGIHGGGGEGHKSFDPGIVTSFDSLLTPPDTSPNGGIFGFQFGHNWQWGPVVGGVEIDFSGADLNDTSSFVQSFCCKTVTFTTDSKIDELASARFRLGYLIFPNWLLFGTAGIGWGHEELNTTQFCSCGPFVSVSSFANEFGWVAGAGVEWKFADHWLLRGEWLHYDFGRTDQFDVFGILDNVRTTVDVGRAALSYKF